MILSGAGTIDSFCKTFFNQVVFPQDVGPATVIVNGCLKAGVFSSGGGGGGVKMGDICGGGGGGGGGEDGGGDDGGGGGGGDSVRWCTSRGTGGGVGGDVSVCWCTSFMCLLTSCALEKVFPQVVHAVMLRAQHLPL